MPEEACTHRISQSVASACRDEGNTHASVVYMHQLYTCISLTRAGLLPPPLPLLVTVSALLFWFKHWPKQVNEICEHALHAMQPSAILALICASTVSACVDT